jgi:hypothetical protein
MPDKVKHVPGTMVHGVFQVAVGLPVRPCELNQPAAFQSVQGRMQPPLLVLDLQGVLVTGAGDHTQDPQRHGGLKRCRGASTWG